MFSSRLEMSSVQFITVVILMKCPSLEMVTAGVVH